VFGVGYAPTRGRNRGSTFVEHDSEVARRAKDGALKELAGLASTLLVRAISRSTTRLIVFLIFEYQWHAGGVLSMASLYRESVRCKQIRRARVVLCILPGDPRIIPYTWFKNHDYIQALESVLARPSRLNLLMLHVPEYAVNRLVVLALVQARSCARCGKCI